MPVLGGSPTADGSVASVVLSSPHLSIARLSTLKQCKNDNSWGASQPWQETSSEHEGNSCHYVIDYNHNHNQLPLVMLHNDWFLQFAIAWTSQCWRRSWFHQVNHPEQLGWVTTSYSRWLDNHSSKLGTIPHQLCLPIRVMGPFFFRISGRDLKHYVALGGWFIDIDH